MRRNIQSIVVTFTVLVLFSLPSNASYPIDDRSDGTISQELQLQMDTLDPEEEIECIVQMKPIEFVFGRDEVYSIVEKINIMRQMAYDSQEPLLRELELEMGDEIKIGEKYWITNSFKLTGKPRKIKRIARKKDVKKISRNGGVRMFDEVPIELAGFPAIGAPENITQIKTGRCWDAGVTGNDVIIAHTDTGVDVTHPALQNSFAGYWYDAIDGNPRPYDDNGHGTHTLGTVLGGDGNGPFYYDIGVAPDAKWVGVKVMDRYGKGSYEQCLKGLQYIAELKADVDIKIVLGSWSVEDRKEDLFFDVCKNLIELDILPIFAVGNSGPSPATSEVPANYPTVLAVGAVDADNQVTDFSSRGPAPDLAAWNQSHYWIDSTWQHTKPDMCAPGVAVLSSTPDNNYALYTGSSMAAPHAAGVAALLLSWDRSLTPYQVYDYLAIGTGNMLVPDNNTGWGAINAWSSLTALDSNFDGRDSQPPSNSKSKEIAVARTQANGTQLGTVKGSGVIKFAIPVSADISASVYDLAGRLIRKLPGGSYMPGEHMMTWDGFDNNGRRSNSGVYFVRLSGDNINLTGKLVLVH